MALVYFLLCPIAIIFAVAALANRRGRPGIFIIVSYLCCSLSGILSLFDVVSKTDYGDTAGILDVYPIVAVVCLAVTVIVTVLNLLAVLLPGGK